MYAILIYIYHKDQPNVGKYTIHGWDGCENMVRFRPCPPSSVEQAAQMREKDGLSQEKRWKNVGFQVWVLCLKITMARWMQFVQ